MNLISDIQSELEAVVKKLWPDVKLPEVDVVTPPHPPTGGPEFGDYSCAVALAIAKELGAKPLETANQLKDGVKKIGGIKEITVTEPGFINFVIDYPTLVQKVLADEERVKTPKSQNIVIEHTSVNPNKAAHIGHLRNACLGDSLVRLMKFLGHHVEIQNYIDDLGLQVADSVVAWETFGEPPNDTPIDRWLWKIYADINKKYEGQPKLLKRREEVLHEMEEGKSETAKQIVENVVEAHLATFGNFGIEYDILAYESDIIKNKLWDKLFEELKNKKLVVQAASGENRGAWLIEFGATDREDKILVRSNGAPTYTAKDTAYRLWQFGVPKMPGYKRELAKIDRVINVVDERQTYPLAVVKHTMAQLGYTRESDNSMHLAYGVVKLSERAAQRLGETASGKSAHSMSGRSGVGVMVNDLLDVVVATQTKERGTAKNTAKEIAIGSIRYYMLKTRPMREIVFDFDEALKTDGNTGVYLQYAYARANNILTKLGKFKSGGVPSNLNLSEKRLTKVLSEMPACVIKAAKECDPSLLCDYAYDLATTFAKFYETSPVIKSAEATKSLRASLVDKYQKTLGQILELLGIPQLTRI